MIKGLTDRGASFPRIGTLRKGAVKPENGKRPGEDLTYFRFTSEPDDPELEANFRAVYGEKPDRIGVYLPAGTPDEVFIAWQEEWVTGGLKHRCDSETCSQWLGADGKYHFDLKPCPGGCKPVGRLSVIVRGLKKFGCVTVLTGSVHDIMNIKNCLDALMQWIPGSHLIGIPFTIMRKPVDVSTPGEGGKRVRREKRLIFIEPDPEWFRLQIESTRKRIMLAASADVVTGEIVGPPGDNDDNPVLRRDNVPTLAAGPDWKPEVVKADEATPMLAPTTAPVNLSAMATDAQVRFIKGLVEQHFLLNTKNSEEAKQARRNVMAYLWPSDGIPTKRQAHIFFENWTEWDQSDKPIGLNEKGREGINLKYAEMIEAKGQEPLFENKEE